MNLGKKKNIIFYQIVSIGFSFLALFVFLGIKLYPQLALMSKSVFSKLETVCGCSNYFLFTNHPVIFTFIGLGGLAGVIFFGWLLFKLIKFKKSTQKFITATLKNRKNRLTPKLKQLSQLLNLTAKLVEVNESSPIIFCFGFWRPKICISSSLVKKLNRRELTAVLLHERYHLLTNEPLRLFLVKFIASVLFFLPGLKSLTKTYLTFSELAADEEATDGFKNKAPLAAALYKLLKMKERVLIKNDLAITFFDVTDQRVDKLINNKISLQTKFFSPKLSFSFLLLLVVFLSFNFFTSFSDSVIHGSQLSNCEKIDPNFANRCQLIKNQDCALDHDSYIPSGSYLDNFCNLK